MLQGSSRWRSLASGTDALQVRSVKFLDAGREVTSYRIADERVKEAH